MAKFHVIKEGGNEEELKMIMEIADQLAEDDLSSDCSAWRPKSKIQAAVAEFMFKGNIRGSCLMEEDDDELFAEEEDSGDEMAKAHRNLQDFQPGVLERIEQQRRAGASVK